MIDETEGEVAAEGDLTIPDAVLFDDSLDEGVDPTALLDDADLPTECAATEPKLGNLSQTAELNDSLCDAEDLDKTQLPASDGDLLAQPTLEAEANTQLKTVSTPPQAMDGNKEHSKSPGLVETKAKAANLEGKAVATSTVESQVSKGVAKVKPSFGKKKKGFTPPKVTAKAATTTSQSENKKLTEKTSDQSSSNASDKTPPQSSSPDKGAGSPKQHPQSNKDGDVKATSERVPSTDAKKVKAADKKMTVEEKKREKEKKEQERALKKQVLEQKKLDRENKKAELERQRNEKRLELERKKAEREKKKMEKELKKMEREQKKVEKQAKANQKQKTKDMEAEDTSSSDDKKCENGSEKVVEGRRHDIEHEPKEDEGVDKTDSVVKSGQQLNIEEKENIPPNVKQSCDISTKDAAATLSLIASCADETKTQNVKFSPQKKGHDQQKTLKANIKEQELNEKQSNDACLESEELAKDTTPAAEKENTEMTLSIPKKDSGQQKVSDSGVKEKEKILSYEERSGEASEHHEELDKNTATVASPLVNTSTQLSGHGGTKNQKMKKAKKFSPPKAKKDAASKTAAKDVKKQKKVVIKMNKVGSFLGGAARNDENKKTLAGAGGKTKKRKPSVYSDSEDELEPKKAKSVDNIGSVWVQCENTNCKKWRLLRDCDDPAKLPGKWVCSMNTDPDHNRCSAEEEQWSDLGDSQEFVESPFIPGSLVWSKMEGYPW